MAFTQSYDGKTYTAFAFNADPANADEHYAELAEFLDTHEEMPPLPTESELDAKLAHGQQAFLDAHLATSATLASMLRSTDCDEVRAARAEMTHRQLAQLDESHFTHGSC